VKFKNRYMKKLIYTIFLTFIAIASTSAQTGKLEVGMKAPAWLLPDANKKEFSMDSWAGKVLQVNYVDPDEQDMNETYNEALDKAVKTDKIIDSTYFKGIGVVDTKSTWKPNGLIRTIAGNKAKKYKTVILFDYKATLQEMWGLPKDSYSVVILDKNRICRYIYSGKIPVSENEKIIQLIIGLTKE
jgi:predicted transcriptional regulator